MCSVTLFHWQYFRISRLCNMHVQLAKLNFLVLPSSFGLVCPSVKPLKYDLLFQNWIFNEKQRHSTKYRLCVWCIRPCVVHFRIPGCLLLIYTCAEESACPGTRNISRLAKVSERNWHRGVVSQNKCWLPKSVTLTTFDVEFNANVEFPPLISKSR